MNNKLPTPAEWNRSRIQFEESKAPVKCPKCGEQMEYAMPRIALLTYPTKYNVTCPACGEVAQITA
jgi:ribosomal protein S27E